MTKYINFTIEPFVYKMTLQDNVLRIDAKHIDECLMWSTTIDDILEDPDSMKMICKEKQFIVNLDPDEIFEIFDYYDKGSLDNNTKITFPSMFKNEEEHICITIDFQISFGKQRHDTKWIILEPEIIPKDVINFQKLEHVKNNVLSKISDLGAKMERNNEKVDSDVDKLEKRVSDLDKRYTELFVMMQNEFKKCEENYQKLVTTELQKLKNSITTDYQSYVDTEIGEMQDTITQQCVTKYQPKITIELTNLQSTITQQCDAKYHPKITTELTNLQSTITQQCDAKYQPTISTELTNLQATIMGLCDTKYQPKA